MIKFWIEPSDSAEVPYDEDDPIHSDHLKAANKRLCRDLILAT